MFVLEKVGSKEYALHLELKVVLVMVLSSWGSLCHSFRLAPGKVLCPTETRFTLIIDCTRGVELSTIVFIPEL